MLDDRIVTEISVDICQEVQSKSYSEEVDQRVEKSSVRQVIDKPLDRTRWKHVLPVCQNHSSVCDGLGASVVSSRRRVERPTAQDDKFFLQITRHER